MGIVDYIGRSTGSETTPDETPMQGYSHQSEGIELFIASFTLYTYHPKPLAVYEAGLSDRYATADGVYYK